MLVAALALLSPAYAQTEFQYEAWHGHPRPPHFRKTGGTGTLTINDAGISFQEVYKDGKVPQHPHAWRWDYQDIQQLKIEPKRLTILTYSDDKWRLGADRQFEFELLSEKSLIDAYSVLKSRLDQRFVAAIADAPAAILWRIPVKHLHPFGGDEGMLEVGAAQVVYRSARTDATRTWRYQDIENISSSGPLQLTITTFEKARLEYGSLKGFNFELKQRLEETRYNDLWLRLNQSKGLKVLSGYREQQ